MLRNNSSAAKSGTERSTPSGNTSGKSAKANTDVPSSTSYSGRTDKYAELLRIKRYSAPAFLVFAVMVLYLISEGLLSGNYINSTSPYITVIVGQLCVYLVPCAFFIAFSALFKGNKATEYGFRVGSMRYFGFWVSSLLVLVLGGMLIKYFGYVLFGTVSSSAVSAAASSDMLYLTVSMVIMPAITEEILFRGVALGAYEKRLGSFGAIMVTSILFAFIHFDPQGFASYLYAGLILGICTAVIRSVFSALLLHLFNNFICIFSDTYLQRISKESISTVFVVFLLVILLLASLFFYFESLEFFCKEKANNRASRASDSPGLFLASLPVSHMLVKAFLAPGFIAAVLLYLFVVIILK